jgi:hypothetical protein
MAISWNSVAGTTEYRIYRSDGVHACDFGKVLLATVDSSTLSYLDTGLQNGRSYSYIVLPMGAADECFGAPSSCSSAAPSAASPGMSVAASSVQTTLVEGDSDGVLDNCEVAQIYVPVSNVGGSTLTNLRITAATSTSHPSSVLLTSLPSTVATSLAACGTATAGIRFQAQGLAAGDTFEADVEFTADGLPSPQTVHVALPLATEGNFQFQANANYSFEAGNQGWTVLTGTFSRVDTGLGSPAPDGTFFRRSSSLINDSCDQVRSPLLRLTPTSTLSMQTHYQIEPLTTQWYDRANVVFERLDTGSESVLTPSSGRPYNASGDGGVCGTAGQPGWAGIGFNTWAASGWTSTALNTAVLAGKVGAFEVHYGTDPGDARDGFRFDAFNLTNVDLVVADGQSDSCTASNLIFADGFFLGNTNPWSDTVP